MPRSLARHHATAFLARVTILALSVALSAALGAAAQAQLIQIKTLPIADGDQWRIFPSANSGMADVSIALADSLLDPFVNPAKAARATAAGGSSFFGSPVFYSVSQHAGGGRTLPAGVMARSGATFASLLLAVQELDDARQPTQNFPVALRTIEGTPVAAPDPSRQNQFAFASVGRSLGRDLSLAGSLQWSGLHDIDGTDLLYAGSVGVQQHGSDVDARLGLTKDWSAPHGTRTLEAIVLHNRFGMTHDVTWADTYWDPNTRTSTTVARVDHDIDQTRTWGLHLGYTQPLPDSAWRIGTIATTNLMSHPRLPDYQIARVAVIPWDPGHSAAYNFGLGVSKVAAGTTFGLDAIYEPIATHTWGEAQEATTTPSGAIIPAGGKTTENHFRFNNAVFRGGLGHELAVGPHQKLRFQLGVAVRSIDYHLDQTDHVAEVGQRLHEHWTEWTRTWGLGLRFSDMEIRYSGRRLTGTGRPGIAPANNVVFAAADFAGSNILAAPNGPLTLTDVAVTTHQISVSLPLR